MNSPTNGMRTAKKKIAGRLGVVLKNVVSVRAEANSKSEQVSQAIIGQSVVAEAGQRNWLFVQTWDGYRGWIESYNIELREDSRQYASSGPIAVIRELFADILEEPTERAFPMTKAPLGAELEIVEVYDDWVKLRLPDESQGFIRKREARLVDKDLAQTIWLPEPSRLIETAVRLIGVPYLWGGTSPFGLDCSGFVQLVYKLHNVVLLRDAYMQACDPRVVKVERESIKPGDLVFFGKGKEPNAKSVNHVGIAIDSDKFIHCS